MIAESPNEVYSPSWLVLGLLLCLTLLIFTYMVKGVESEEPYYHINMKQDLSIAPESKANLSAEAEVKEVAATNGFWTIIDTWTLPSREQDFFYSIDRVNVWYSFEQEPGIESYPCFRYVLLIDGETAQTNTGCVGDPGDEKIYEAEYSLGDEEFYLSKDSTVEMVFEYNGEEDLKFYYDGPQQDTGFHGRTDFIRVWNFTAQGSLVQLELYDLFDSGWEGVANYMELRVNGEEPSIEKVEVAPGKQQENNGTKVESRLLVWELAEVLMEGDEVELWLKYTLATHDENKGSRHFTNALPMGIGEPQAGSTEIDQKNEPSPWSSLDDNKQVVLGGALGTVVLGTIVKWKRRGEELELDDDW